MSLVKDVPRAEHSSLLAAHPGGSRMYQTLRDYYYWPSLAADVFGWVSACPTCAKNRLMGTQSTASMRLFPTSEFSSALAIDLLVPFPQTPEGYEYILVICDRFTTVTGSPSEGHLGTECPESIVNNSGHLDWLFYSRTNSASLKSHM